MQTTSPLSQKVKFCCRAFRQLQKHGPLVKIRGAEEHVCQNCGRSFVGNYCPACGQNSTIERFTWKNLFQNVVMSFFSIDQGFWRTVLDLLYRPGYMIRDYLNGHRTPYFKPFQLLFVLTAVILLVLQIYYGDLQSAREQFIQSSAHVLYDVITPDAKIETGNGVDSFILAKVQRGMEAIQSIAWSDTTKRLSSMLYNWLVGNLTSVVLLILPFMYVAQRRTFRKTKVGRGMSGPETLIAMVYICDNWLILCLLSSILSYFTPVIFSILGFFMVLYWIFCLHQLYEVSYLKAVLYAVKIILRLWLYVWLFSLCMGVLFFILMFLEG